MVYILPAPRQVLHCPWLVQPLPLQGLHDCQAMVKALHECQASMKRIIWIATFAVSGLSPPRCGEATRT